MRLKQAARLQERQLPFMSWSCFLWEKRKGKGSYPVSLWAYLSHSSLYPVMPSYVGVPSVHRERIMRRSCYEKWQSWFKMQKWGEVFNKLVFWYFPHLLQLRGSALWSWSVKIEDFPLVTWKSHCRQCMQCCPCFFVSGHQHKDCINKFLLILR